jgi:hypothetical protein
MNSHPSPATGQSQCDLILAVLERNAGRWVSMMDLAVASQSMNIHSRIAELRERRNLTIQNEQRKHGRKRRSYYRLIINSTPTQPELF